MWLPFLSRRAREVARADRWELAVPLYRWSQQDAWTIGDAVTGTLVTGATGSGKTSGSGRALATAMLRHGFGGLVLTTKPDERSLWEGYCRETGRAEDLVVVDAGASHRLNFLDYEATRPGEGAGLTENLVNLFSNVLEVGDRGSKGSGGREDEGYWRRASRQLIRNAIDALLLAQRRITVPDLYRVIISAPTSQALKRSPDWQAGSLWFQCLTLATRRQKTPREEADLEVVADYFMHEFPSLNEKTRSVIVSTFTSMADVLMRGHIREIFCSDTNITPEVIQDGKIVVIDLPVKTFADVGVFAQVLWKYAFQRSIERRDTKVSKRPVFLWADEAQNFITSSDMQFQATCRSSLVATVYLTQNVNNVHAVLGGERKGQSEAASLFANLNVKILHSNGDPVTNQWASTLIGRSPQIRYSGASSVPTQDRLPFALGVEQPMTPGHANAGFSEQMDFEVEPGTFTKLRTGGPANDWTVDGIVFQSGRRFRSTGKTWLPVSFQQQR